MPKVACDKKGTHSLQALISIINRDEEEKLIEENLRDYVVMLSKVLYFSMESLLMQAIR